MAERVASARRLTRRRWDHRMSPRLAFVSPLPPAPTGVATYADAVLSGLRRLGFMERHDLDVVWPIEPKHEGLIPWYALGIYQLGNNVEFHRDIYRFACQAPGLIVLHDLALDDFVRGMKAAGDPLGYVAEREAARLRGRLRSPDVLASEPLREPWCGHVVRRARGIIVHSDFGRRYLEELGCRTPVFVVPHPVVERPEDVGRAEARGRELRRPLEAAGAEVVVGAFGDLNQAKCLDVVMEAVRRIDARVHLVLVGRRITGYDVDAAVAASGLGTRVTLAADVSDRDFLGWLAAADVAVDLRYPHRGEVSGSLVRAMQVGRPTVVSGTGSYLDLPDDLVVKVGAGRPDPDEVAAVIEGLVRDPGRRRAMGERARARTDELARTEATARGYALAIEGTLALVRDPARRALARWAGALSDIGITEEDLGRGCGLSYVRALEQFARRSP